MNAATMTFEEASQEYSECLLDKGFTPEEIITPVEADSKLIETSCGWYWRLANGRDFLAMIDVEHGMFYEDLDPVEKWTREELIDWLVVYYQEGLEDASDEDLITEYAEKMDLEEGSVVIVESVM